MSTKKEREADARIAERAEAILVLLLDCPEQERALLCASLQYNEVFCWHCGYGSRETPNANCQCGNDE